MSIETVYSPTFAALSKKGEDAFMKVVLATLRKQTVDHEDGIFSRDADGWYSPDMVERVRQGFDDLTKSLEDASN